jgi:hypothetical protein
MYDRTTLRAVARAAGVTNPNQLAVRLDIPRKTARRLWHGRVEPTAATAAAVQAAFGLPVGALLVRAATEPAA